MKVSFARYTRKDKGIPEAPQNVERVNWIAAAGKTGRSIDEIVNHPKHYDGTLAKIAEHLRYDLERKFIKIILTEN